nr:type II toxin-antitoxin system RelE/ParE family toxin [uncultured Brumimicrobium sp.]
MSYSIYVTQTFKKEFKKLAKKYPSLKSDLENLSNELLSKPTAGVNLGKDFYKVRMAISSKGKGKSAGARIITHVKIIDSKIYLTSIYDKSNKVNISDKELQLLVHEIDK